MRVSLAIAILALGACAMHPGVETAGPPVSAPWQDQQPAPASADAALRPYYAGLLQTMPYAGDGIALPDPASVLTHIDFGSCHAPYKPIPVLATIAADAPDLFLYMGDNVYGDAVSGNATLPELREQYGKLAANPDFQKLRQSVPMMVTWDDHDYGQNDAGGDFAFKHYSQEVFTHFWGLPANDPRRTRDGVYSAQTFGVDGKRVQIIMLDTRFFRSSPLKPTDKPMAKGKERYLPSEDAGMTMLGAAQWQWLADELQKPADIRVIVTSIQALAMDHGWEAWKEIMPERDHLFATIRQSGAKGVLLVSGDRHIAAFYKQAGKTDYPLYEFTSSALNMGYRDHVDEYDSRQLVEAFGPNNFGSMFIDWDGRAVNWQIRDETGTPQREMTISFSEIGL